MDPRQMTNLELANALWALPWTARLNPLLCEALSRLQATPNRYERDEYGDITGFMPDPVITMTPMRRPGSSDRS